MGNKFNKKLEKTQEKKENAINSNIKDEYKVIFLGESGTGAKTNLINILVGKDFNENEYSTVGFNYSQKNISLENNKHIILNLCDTVGQEKYRELNGVYLNGIDCAVLGYAINYKETFEEIKNYWCPRIKKLSYCKLIYLIGNKRDLILEREVAEEEAMKYAESENLRFFEISAKTGDGIHEFFDDLVHNIIKQQ